MLKVLIKKITLTNFMGFDREVTFDFGDRTIISGDNASGKSTIFNAFKWLITGKSTDERSEFNIKNTVNTALNRSDHVVEAIISINGEDNSLKKIYREKWQTKKGSVDSEFTGHTTDYYWNDAPLSKGDYDLRISELIKPEILKSITDVHYFNELDWKKRRLLLSEMANIPSDEQIAADFKEMWEAKGNRSIDDFKAMTLRNIDLCRTSIKETEILLKDKHNSLTSFGDIAEIQQQLDGLEHKKNLILNAIADKNAENEAISAYNNDILKKKEEFLSAINIERKAISANYDLLVKEKMQQINALRAEYSELEAKFNKEMYDLNSIKEYNKSINATRSDKYDELNALRDKYKSIEAETFAGVVDDTCMHCGQKYPTEKVQSELDKLKSEFIKNKESKLKFITDKGLSINKEVESLLEKPVYAVEDVSPKLSIINLSISKLQNEISDIPKPSDSKEVLDLISKMEALSYKDSPTISRAELDDVLREIDQVSAPIKMTSQVKIDIDKLKTKLSDTSATLSNSLRLLDQINGFIEAKINLVQSSVNSLFKDVEFKMFDELINGGKEECCISLYKGVPYLDVNTAGKINMGIEIINVLNRYYSTYFPIFVDNAEAVNEIINCDSQLILLTVSKTKLQCQIQS